MYIYVHIYICICIYVYTQYTLYVLATSLKPTYEPYRDVYRNQNHRNSCFGTTVSHLDLWDAGTSTSLCRLRG